MPPNVETKSKHDTTDESASTTGDERAEEFWSVPVSKRALRTVNPIRAIVDPILAQAPHLQSKRNDGKYLLNLSLGDPSVYSYLVPPKSLIEAAKDCAESPRSRNYVNACGSDEARQSIAKAYSSGTLNISADDVIIGNGCSGVLELVLGAILDEGSSIMVPKPGFPLYGSIARSYGATIKSYSLLPSSNWECNFEHMESIVDESVRAIIINNPSNPCGSVFSTEHLADICKFAEKHRLPIISDEVYYTITFGRKPFKSILNVANEIDYLVPIICVSGLSKQFLCPGIGWVVFLDKMKHLLEIKRGVRNLAQLVLGASHLAQGVVSTVMTPPTPSQQKEIASWKKNLCASVSSNSEFFCRKLAYCEGLRIYPPSGAIYIMIEEQNVFVLPGSIFDAPGFFRVVLCAPTEILSQAADRIRLFCSKYICHSRSIGI